MKKTLAFLILCGGFLSCEQAEFYSESEPISFSSAGSWKLISYEDYSDGSIILKDSANSFGGLDVIITFSSDLPQTYTGLNTNNTFHGKFTVDNSQILNVDYHVSSEALEPTWGKMFTGNITQVQKYSLSHENLILFYDDGKKAMKFEKLN